MGEFCVVLCCVVLCCVVFYCFNVTSYGIMIMIGICDPPNCQFRISHFRLKTSVKS